MDSDESILRLGDVLREAAISEEDTSFERVQRDLIDAAEVADVVGAPAAASVLRQAEEMRDQERMFYE